jgi:hypothetical protein
MVESGLPTTFRGYHEVVFGLGADLQRVEDLASRLGNAGVRDKATSLRTRVQQQRFTVAVLGEFKRGKSTFINALLGEAVLPSDIAPTTACINRVVYGLRPAATLYFKDQREPTDVPVDRLEESITKLTAAAAERAAEVSEAVIAWPIRFCSNGIDLLDTPGLADEAAMSEVTRRVLPQVDAALFVIMADSPFSESEGRFLEELLEHDPGRVIFVVTAIDRIRKVADRDRLLDNIRDRIRKRLLSAAERRFADADERITFLEQLGSPRVFGLSGLSALEARQDGDREALERSGLPAFEAFLESFLTTANAVGLRRRLHSAAALCGELASELDSSIGPVADEDAEAVLALLAALDGALSQGLRDVGGRARDRASKMLMTSTRKSALQVLEAMLLKRRAAALLAHHGGTLTAFSRDFADSLASQFRRRIVKGLTPAFDQLVRKAWVPAQAEVTRLAIAADYVLNHAHLVSGVVTDGPRATQDAVAAYFKAIIETPPTADDLGVDDLASRLALTDDALFSILQSAAVLEAIGREPPKDLISQFTNVFNTPDKEWAAAVSRAISSAWMKDFPASQMLTTVRDGFEARSSIAALDKARQRIRQAELAIETSRQRRAALSERDAQDRDRDRATALTIQAQATSLAIQLGEVLSD